eukprot:gene20336-22337_t
MFVKVGHFIAILFLVCLVNGQKPPLQEKDTDQYKPVLPPTMKPKTSEAKPPTSSQCPPGQVFVSCTPDSCDKAYCPEYPTSFCKPNNCDSCNAEFYTYEKRSLVKIADCGKDCSEACPRNYDPVCGDDGQTYGNHCTFNAEKCKKKGALKIAHRGEYYLFTYLRDLRDFNEFKKSFIMNSLSSYTLELEPEQKHVFVTQIREEADEKPKTEAKEFPVIREEKGKLLEAGKNTLQQTLLLKREAEIDKVQYELDIKRKNFEERMEECRYKKEELKVKQKIIRDRIQKFEKFVKENDAKRKRAIIKYQQELKTSDNKMKELEQVQSELAKLLLRHHKLKQKLAKFVVFEEYLMKVLDSLPEGYLESTDNMLTALMMRFRTLSSTNNLLVKSLAKRSDEVELGQKKIQELQENHVQSLLLFNSELASTQKHLESLRERNMKLEQIYTAKKMSIRQQTETFGQTLIAIDNIADKCLRRPKETENMSYFQKLDLIKEFVSEREDVYSLAKSNVSNQNSAAERTRESRLKVVNVYCQIFRHMQFTSAEKGNKKDLAKELSISHIAIKSDSCCKQGIWEGNNEGKASNLGAQTERFINCSTRHIIITTGVGLWRKNISLRRLFGCIAMCILEVRYYVELEI